MSSFRLILASLVHYWRVHVAVGLGVVAATAVLCGALIVGDSMRYSLRRLTLDRLGRIDELLLVDHFFAADLAQRVEAAPGFADYFREAQPAVILRASMENPGADGRRAGRIHLVGCEASFWKLGRGGPKQHPPPGQIVINRPLADQLGVRAAGAEVLLRLPRITAIPADSALGRKDETVRSTRLRVSEILPAEGLGRFSLRPSQQLPRNAFVDRAWLAKRLKQPGQANAVFVAGGQQDHAPDPRAHDVLQGLLRPKLADYGIRIELSPRGYFNLTNQRMILPEPAERGLLEALEGWRVQPALTYLANTIARGDREIPYSTVTALDPVATAPLGPFVLSDGRALEHLESDEIVLNTWAAEQLEATPGDTIRLVYFEPESGQGELRQATAQFRLAGIVKLEGAAADPDFTPSVPGVTDQLSMADWNPPFPFEAGRIRAVDERYWKDHRGTPKAFVSLATGRRLWASRFGRTTSLRIAPRQGVTAASLADSLHLPPQTQGFLFQPVKRQGLAASVGATPFDVLFLAFSFFVAAAAVMLIVLLFRLGVEQRAAEVGILQAVGFASGRVARLLLAEGLIVAAVAGVLGVGVGIGYGWLMLSGLRTWWLAAVVTPFLRLHVSAETLAIGYLVGLGVGSASIIWAVWRQRRASVPRLLAGEPTAQPMPLAPVRLRRVNLATGAVLVGAVAVGLAAVPLGEEARAGAFFGAGALVLAASLLAVRARLRSGATGAAVAVGRGNLLRLSLRNAARNPGRSTLSMGLIAATSFLIVAISAFHLDPAGRVPRRDSGDGGFALVAQSDQPIYRDLNSPDGRADLGFSEQDSGRLADATVFALRVKPGDDASCLNLYQPRQPRVLGLPRAMIDRGGFAWAAHARGDPAENENPWRLLLRPPLPDRDGALRVPVVLDKATAAYSLHLTKGVGQTYDIQDGAGKTIRLEIVGLLNNSVFQSDLLIGEKSFLECFPQVSGRRFFLVDSPPEQTAAVAAALNRGLGDFGLSTETSGNRLARFLAVQNTYLSTFQSLAGLGLLLGTLGLAAVEARNVLERRRELALLRAVGFRRATLGGMVLWENGLVLLAGLACGVVSAGVAVLPHLVTGSATIPFRSLGGTLLLILATGLAAGLFAVRAVVTAPLVAALRGQ